MAVLGLHLCARAPSSRSKWGPLLIAVRGPLKIAASLVAEHRLQMRRLSNCGPRAQLLRDMWDPPRPGLEPVSPALAGRFSTAAPPGKPYFSFFVFVSLVLIDCSQFWILLFVLLFFFPSPFFSFFCVCVCVCVCYVVAAVPLLLFLLFVLGFVCLFLFLCFFSFSFLFLFFPFLSFFFGHTVWLAALGSLAKGRAWASGVGGPSPGHWTTRAQEILISMCTPGGIHINTKTQPQTTACRLQCWTPHDKQPPRQEHRPTNQQTGCLKLY